MSERGNLIDIFQKCIDPSFVFFPFRHDVMSLSLDNAHVFLTNRLLNVIKCATMKGFPTTIVCAVHAFPYTRDRARLISFGRRGADSESCNLHTDSRMRKEVSAVREECCVLLKGDKVVSIWA